MRAINNSTCRVRFKVLKNLPERTLEMVKLSEKIKEYEKVKQSPNRLQSSPYDKRTPKEITQLNIESKSINER